MLLKLQKNSVDWSTFCIFEIFCYVIDFPTHEFILRVKLEYVYIILCFSAIELFSERKHLRGFTFTHLKVNVVLMSGSFCYETGEGFCGLP